MEQPEERTATETAASVTLRKGRDHSVRRFHPWIFSGAIAAADGPLSPGCFVRVLSEDGKTLGLGQWSPESQIRVRMLAFGETPFFSCSARVADAIDARKPLLESGTTDAARLVNAEADGLPGVVIDKYGDWAVCQFNTAGAAVLKNEIVASLMDSLPLKGVYERSDEDMLRREGLEGASRRLIGEEPPEKIEIHENGVRFLVDPRAGHKTGFYLDQRDNRRIVAELARDKDVLNVFSYTGGFGTAALHGVKAPDEAFMQGNAFEVLRRFRDSRRTFDIIVLDPPKFAESRSAVRGAARGYKDINLLAMKLLRPGGILATFSCSGAITPEIFGDIVADAAVDAGIDFTILRRLWQAGDHAQSLFFPEGLYLKGLLLRKNVC